jgi:hypothetical protein
MVVVMVRSGTVAYRVVGDSTIRMDHEEVRIILFPAAQ